MPVSLSIVIPAYNEAKRLPPTLRRVVDYLAEKNYTDWEILVVNDGSTDTTADLVKEFSGGDTRIQLLNNPGNKGKGYAVRNGMLHSQKEWSLLTDADLSAPIEEVERLVNAVQSQNAIVAIGSRAVDRSLVSVHQSIFRELSGRSFNLVMRIVTGLPFKDTQCGFKLFRTDAAREIFRRQQTTSFGFDVENLMVAKLLGYKTVEVGVRWANVEGTKVSLFAGIRSFLEVLEVRWYQLRGRYR